MQTWLEYRIRRSENYIFIRLEKRSDAEGNRFMNKIEDCGNETVTICWFDTLASIVSEIGKAKFRLYKKYKKNEKFYSSIDFLCRELSKGKQILEDSATRELINKAKPTV